MADLKKLTDQVLIEATDRVVAREREALISVLEHLREMERRRLFSALGYTSLWEYAIKRLKYSEDQAWRRISAMRMMKELPEIEEKIESGALTLTCLGLAHTHFRSEEKSRTLAREEKTALLEQLENKSKREAEQIVLKQSSAPTQVKPDKIKAVAENLAVVQFTADQGLLDKIERLKGLLAHSHPDMTLAELMNKLCDLGLKEFDPARKHKSAPAPARVKESEMTPYEPKPSEMNQTKAKPHGTQPAKTKQVGAGQRRHISASLKREVWSKSGGKCSHCGSQRALQIEHIHPIAMGGDNDPNNLTLLCRPCNQRSAIEKLGLKKMDAYLNSSFT